jgi:plasmid stabilization system protein ParE
VVDRTVRWSDAAQRDVDNIVDFIADNSPLNAERVLERLQDQARKLAFHAERGRRLPELTSSPNKASRLWREVVIRPWRMVYAIECDRVLVLAVVDSRRDMTAWLERHLARLTDLTSPG